MLNMKEENDYITYIYILTTKAIIFIFFHKPKNPTAAAIIPSNPVNITVPYIAGGANCNIVPNLSNAPKALIPKANIIKLNT